MRLIDTDAEIAKIEKEIEKYEVRIVYLEDKRNEEPDNNYNDWDEKIKQCKRDILDCKKEIRMLRSYRTAYDVDEIVEQILNITVNLFCDGNRNGGKTLYATTLEEYRRTIIDIVKEGGLKCN